MLKYILNSCPAIFVLLLVAYSFYSYIFAFALVIVEGTTKRVIYLVLYHIFLLLFTWAFLQATFKFHDPIPEEYRLSPDEHDHLSSYSEDEADQILKKVISLRRLDIYTCTPNGRIRYCKLCKLIKPDRAHHCSSCARCILKMDHHCPWIANCVGFSNYKHFILMLVYGTAWCIFYVGTMAEYLTIIFKDFQTNLGKLAVMIGFLMATFTGMLVSILFFYHFNLICRNETTLEALRDITFREDNLTFDLGKWRNFSEVFGDNVCCWLIPVYSGKGNGYEYDMATLI